MSYHQTIIVGNVGQAPELRYTQQGTAVCSFSVAVNERYKDVDKTTWYKVTAWSSLAEIVNQYVDRGKLVMVIGTVSVSAYTDKSGNPAAALELTARDVRFLGSKLDGSPVDDEGVPF